MRKSKKDFNVHPEDRVSVKRCVDNALNSRKIETNNDVIEKLRKFASATDANPSRCIDLNKAKRKSSGKSVGRGMR